MILLQRVIHKCALCKELLLLDADAIAMHLKSKHKGVSHKEYNAKYMVMGGRVAGSGWRCDVGVRDKPCGPHRCQGPCALRKNRFPFKYWPLATGIGFSPEPLCSFNVAGTKL